MLMAKSRHKKPENVRRYFKPSPEVISELTSMLAPGRRAPLTLLCMKRAFGCTPTCVDATLGHTVT